MGNVKKLRYLNDQSLVFMTNKVDDVKCVAISCGEKLHLWNDNMLVKWLDIKVPMIFTIKF